MPGTPEELDKYDLGPLPPGEQQYSRRDVLRAAGIAAVEGSIVAATVCYLIFGRRSSSAPVTPSTRLKPAEITPTPPSPIDQALTNHHVGDQIELSQDVYGSLEITSEFTIQDAQNQHRSVTYQTPSGSQTQTCGIYTLQQDTNHFLRVFIADGSQARDAVSNLTDGQTLPLAYRALKGKVIQIDAEIENGTSDPSMTFDPYPALLLNSIS